MNIIEFQSVYKDFDGVIVLNDINYTFVQGSVTAIIGPSGSGKSTMLRCINQMETVSKGNILFKNISVTDRKTNINSFKLKCKHLRPIIYYYLLEVIWSQFPEIKVDYS